MRKLLALALVAFPLVAQSSLPLLGVGAPAAAGTAITLADHTTLMGNGTSPSMNCGGANFIAVCVSDYMNSGYLNVYSSTSVPAASWHTDTHYFNAANSTLAYAYNVTLSATEAVTISGGTYPGFSMACFKNVATTSILDTGTGAASVSAVTTMQPGSITPSQANDLVISCLSIDGGANTITVSGMTLGATSPGQAGSIPSGLAYVIQTTATAVNPTWSFASANAATGIRAIK